MLTFPVALNVSCSAIDLGTGPAVAEPAAPPVRAPILTSIDPTAFDEASTARPAEGSAEIGDLRVAIREASVFTQTPYPGIPLVFDMTFDNDETGPVAVSLHGYLFDAAKLEEPEFESKYVQKLKLSGNTVSRIQNVVGPKPDYPGSKLILFEIYSRDATGEVIRLDQLQLDGIQVIDDPGA
ncbi:hypothetical protein QO034_22675 [Sedimentitalea sp. JM2-8]|uniref:DUF4352 domain-containing protein n=1 Tax=Sedimentitalea xiamensis TaxID=3050037 RepID=A0ABT7FL30_9RHOB|nr:hypothetical protein [Sedimentitalea xiamensis]MDK3075862.1 hypothetical protein [Sedimentitalea xiamensis]